MGFLSIQNLIKRYDTVTAVDDISFEVEQGEFLTLLGPSGCGKTTTLRIIAGLEESDHGEVYIGGRLVQSRAQNTFVEPNKRDLGMVFQSYAIWPHLTVAQNVAYPLAERGLGKAEIEDKVHGILHKVKLEGMGNRPATKLSGGQQQRVALARALVYNPAVLLFDEPLSNLDAKLRIEMRNEIRLLQRSLGITTIYVTHDQEEAFALSDRIIVMKEGRIEQIGDQAALYFEPQTRFVTEFIGQTNLIEGEVVDTVDERALVAAMGASLSINNLHGLKPGDAVCVAIRPDYIKINPDDELDNQLSAKVIQRQYLGSFCNYYLSLEDSYFNVVIHGITRRDIEALPSEGETIELGFQANDCVSFKIG